MVWWHYFWQLPLAHHIISLAGAAFILKAPQPKACWIVGKT